MNCSRPLKSRPGKQLSPGGKNMKLKEAVMFGEKQLASLELPYLESTILLCHALGISREKLFTLLDDELSDRDFAVFRELIIQRRNGIPSAYITGKKEFWSRDFIVSRDVLIPRPDTEILVETAVKIAVENKLGSILDLCTGSGCIAVSLALELPAARISASDISEEAYRIFDANCARHNAKIDFFHSDLFQNINSKFEMIVTNPPYLTDCEVAKLNEEGLHEPRLALAAGRDGLDIIRKIVEFSMDYLLSDGYLLIEASKDQCDVIECLLIESGYCQTDIVNDLAGRKRVVTGRYNGNKT